MLISVFGERQMEIRENVSGINYRYMDGGIRNRKHCAGYCSCNQHPGCMDEKMIREHQCYEKECDYFFHVVDEIYSELKQRQKAEKKARRMMERRTEKLIEHCNGIAQSFAGIKVISAKEMKGAWLLEYIMICTVDLDGFHRKLSEALGNVRLVKKNCDYDSSVRLFLES